MSPMREIMAKLLLELAPDIRELLEKKSDEGLEYWQYLPDPSLTVLKWQYMRDYRK